MGWDEAIFGWFHGAWRGMRAPRPAAKVLARRVALESQRDRLQWLSSAVAERSITVREAEADGGWQGDVLLLPAHLDMAATRAGNERAYLVRAVWASYARPLARRLRPLPESPRARVWATAFLAEPVLRQMRAELPGAARPCVALTRSLLLERAGQPTSRAQAQFERWIARAVGLGIECEIGPPDLSFEEFMERTASLEGALPVFPLFGAIGTEPAHGQSVSGTGDADALPDGTERKGKVLESPERVELPTDPLQDNPLVHSFEKVHTAEEYQGGMKHLDGDDEMDAHADAIDELDLREVVRSLERAQSLLRVDVMLEGSGEVADQDSEGTPYPEWDRKRGQYRDAWCRVRAGRPPARMARADAEAAIRARVRRLQREHEAVRAELERLDASRRWKNRQLDGAEIDLDALVDWHACLAAGTTVPARLYRDRRPSHPSLSVMLLLDGSLSTDGWVDDVRVLDLEIDAAVTLGEALSAVRVELSMAAFHSQTRLDCRFEILKTFTEEWTDARHRLADLQPRGYTRIGPALRHATELLSRTDARRRLVVVLTDGKPNDYDRYEGRHGIADVRRAVLDAEARGVHIHAFAIDHDARFHLPQMFGRGRFHLLRQPRSLPRALGEAVAAMHPG